MIQLDEPADKSIINHKGLPCPYKPITCQEGYCNECEIYNQWCLSLYREPT